MSNHKKTRKKRRFKYRLVWPWNNPRYQAQKAQQPKKRRRKRKLKWQFYLVIPVLFAIFLAFYIPRAVTDSRLKNLGYDKETIKAIREYKLQDTLIENNYYSVYLANSIKDKTVNLDYLEMYTIVSVDRGLDNLDFLLISRLKEKGYEQSQIKHLYQTLNVWEMTPLLVFDYQMIEDNYIEDCINHRDENSETNFVLSGTYFTPYENTIAVPHIGTEMLVNKTYHLDETYIPNVLTDLSTWYASSDQRLAQVAAKALEDMCNDGREVDHVIYAASAYRTYESQETLYNNYVLGMGQKAADQASARAGHSEHQTGLAIDLSVSNEDGSLAFKDTQAYQWVKKNCMNYGWILRYPEGKESITQYEFESWHYRYVGPELAQAVYDSNLTYDEYWCLYLKPWDDEANAPSKEILHSLSYKASESQSSEETQTETQEIVTADPAEIEKAQEALDTKEENGN